MRQTIKAKPETLEAYKINTAKHIDEWLGGTQFNHEVSQKETIVFQD
jgi:hypothetical protein